MDLIDKNLNLELSGPSGQPGRLGDLLERNGSKVSIRYGYNSGCYENHVYFITKDGGALHIDTVIAEIDRVDFTDDYDQQWRLTAYDVNYEDNDLTDDHTGEKIPAAHS
ncbi:hypothetical protein [Mycolicibacterium sp.]|uniref:hypothetical protein n=1 Tax=Mycolicibacterium sp. TaxID=2320850 RepID=UPI00355E5DF9